MVVKFYLWAIPIVQFIVSHASQFAHHVGF
jgi:hypothetical protein